MTSSPKFYDCDQLIKFYNCFIIRDGQLVKEDFWIKSGKIINPEPIFYDEKSKPDVVIDCKHNIIAPGYIDLQINGGYGFDFSNDNVDIEKAIDSVARGIVASGVTSFCPTLITQSPESYKKIIPFIHRRPGSLENGASILGLHLEGPFINRKKRGAHPEHLVRDNIMKSFNELVDVYGTLEDVAIITLAPELDGGSIIKEIVSRNIIVSMGHSVATLNQGYVAISNGANFITHLFNAMLPFHHRDPGLVGLLAHSYPNSSKVPVYYGIIADGIHTHDAALRIAYQTNPDGLVCVTDAISALGLEPGKKHKLGEQFIEICDSKAFIAGTETLCGSIATMSQCVRNLNAVTNCGIVKAVECASLHPAQVLGITEFKGTLNFGSDADFIILDNQLNVLATFIGGQKVWIADHFPIKAAQLS